MNNANQTWLQILNALPASLELGRQVSATRLATAEKALSHPLPDELAALLRVADGVTEGEYKVSFIWNLDRVVQDNLHFREAFAELYMPFDHLLFFGDAGNGDQFAVPIRPARADVYVWNHENDGRIWVAPNLARFCQWWLEGKITT